MLMSWRGTYDGEDAAAGDLGAAGVGEVAGGAGHAADWEMLVTEAGGGGVVHSRVSQPRPTTPRTSVSQQTALVKRPPVGQAWKAAAEPERKMAAAAKNFILNVVGSEKLGSLLVREGRVKC